MLQFGPSVTVRFWGYEYSAFLQPSKAERERKKVGTAVNLLEGITKLHIG